MFIKKICCWVKEGQKSNFSIAQGKWQALSSVGGFIIQVGGWSADGHNAIIYSVWEDKSKHDGFMRDYHDVIYDKTGQKNTYEAIDIIIEALPAGFELAKLDKIMIDLCIKIVPEWRLKAD